MTDDKLELTRRKILGSVGAVGAAGAAAGLGTSALFSDEESFTNNSITAGTLDMTVDASVPSDGINDEWVGAVDFDGYEATADGEPAMGVTLGDMKPGDWVILCYEITVSSNPACLSLEVDNTANDENSVTEPEADREDDISGSLANPNTSVMDSIPDPDGKGELAQNLEVTVYDDLDTGPLDGTLSGATSALSNELLGGVTLADVWSTFGGGGAIAADTQNFDFYLLLELPTETGNEVQSDSVEWDFVFDAVQSRNNECDTPVWEEGECDCPDTDVDTSESQSSEVSVQSTDASSYPEVTTFLDIDTDDGNTEGGLTTDDFALAEDGCGQEVSVDFTSEDKPVDFVFLMDVTGSMGGELNGVKDNITADDGFISSVNSEGIDANYALYLYGDDDPVADDGTGEPAVFLKQSLTDNSDGEFEDAVDSTSLKEEVGYGNDVPEDNYEAILTADDELSYRPGSQRVMIDITDAPGEEDTGDFVGGTEETRDNAVSVLNDNGYTYIAVAEDESGPDEKKPMAQNEVDDGLFIELGTDFDPILDKVTDEVATSWRVRYTTACPDEDGSTRDVVIEIDDSTGTLYATTSYTAPGS